MELRKYWFVISKWSWLILAITLIATAASFVVTRSSPNVYSATVTILVSQGQNPSTPDYNSILTSERLTQTYSQLITTKPILAKVIQDLGLAVSTTELAAAIDVKSLANTQLLQVSVRGAKPALARDIANTLAKEFIDDNTAQRLGATASSQKVLQQQIANVSEQIATLNLRLEQARSASGPQSTETLQLQATLSQQQLTYSQLLKAQSDQALAEGRVVDQIRVVEPAESSDVPIWPKLGLTVVLTAIASLLLGVAVAFFLEYIDDTVKSPDDALAITGLSALGTISRMPGNDREHRRLVNELSRQSQIAEAYRILRTNIDFARVSLPGQSILVTSANQSEGKTTTLANLALVMAEGGRDVVVVDTDLRRPTLHKVFNVPNEVGLTNLLLTNEPDLTGAIQPTNIPHLRIMTSGPIPPNPSELLASPRMDRILARLRDEAEIILLDSPPVLAVTDPTILSARTDGVVLVIDAGKTRNEALKRAKATLDRGSAHFLGVVMNRVTNRVGGGYYYNYSRYHAQGGERAERANGRTRALEKSGPKWLLSLRRAIGRR